MRAVKFSKREIIHLAVSVSVMGLLVALNMVGGVKEISVNFLFGILMMLPFSLLIIVPAFVFHEIGHKIIAQKFGFWAEYMMWKQGLLLAVLIAVITHGAFLFIAPGAVYFAPSATHRPNAEKIGKIGLIGPLINILLSVIFGLLALMNAGTALSYVFAAGAGVNAFLAIFNLIPFPPFDGQKVFAWDKKTWAAAMTLSVVLYAVSFSL